ncbi:E3 SUMO-protein ligase MMS21 [Quercus robur]|uniref:E3 SUMO-protein ligase MMS21 n=1 Tax=Quercus lobata TaxID=97700 RepID=UPI001245737D|nr:E3 SUMO-protein ligase MMS21 [Quercus lobata]XP_050247651.1 E3 SUMO-protein ligase MMS21 [Quercus robur]
MASTSASRSSGGVSGRIRTAASTLYSDNQSLIAEIRKALNMMKEVAIDLERDNQSQMVKEIENAAVELSGKYEQSTHFSTAIHSVADRYQLGPELTNFKKLFDDEIVNLKANSSSVPENHPIIRQFREAIWNVHHAGQPMPGEEQEDIVMTTTQSNLLNVTCPLSGKPVTELAEPVRSVECKHVYEKKVVMVYIRSNARQCPVAGCPKILRADKIVCDPLLLIEIEEMRAMSKQSAPTSEIEDCTALDEEEDD